VLVMSLLPLWKKMKGIAHTLANDLTILEPYQQARPLNRARFAQVSMPTLVMAGGKSPAYMQHGMRHLADVLPNAEHATLPGQTHMVTVLAPELITFFSLAPAGPRAKELLLSR
jgi:pimeloyl-ACP methyl ester carboxylesterase